MKKKTLKKLLLTQLEELEYANKKHTYNIRMIDYYRYKNKADLDQWEKDYFDVVSKWKTKQHEYDNVHYSKKFFELDIIKF